MKNLKFLLLLLISINSYSQTDTASYNKAKNLYFEQHYIEAIEAFEKYMLKENDIKTTADCYHYIGISYYMVGDHEMASKSIFENLELNKNFNDIEGVGNAYNNLGAIYDVQKKYEEALNYYQKSLDVSKKLKDTISIAASLNNIASAKINLNRNEEAFVDLWKALKINEKYEQTYAIILNHRNIGNIYNNIGDLENALKHHTISLDLSIELEHQQTISASYENVGEDYIKFGDYNKSIEYLKKSYDISKSLDLLYYTQVACKNLSIAYDSLNMPDSSLLYYKLYSSARDSVFSKENQEYTSYLDIKYKTKEKENEILKMTHRDEIQKHEIQKQEITNNLLLLIAAVVSITGFIIILLYKKTKKALTSNVIMSSILQEKNKDITDSIMYAKNIQHGIISTPENFNKDVKKSFVMFEPKDIVSGDFYWDLNLGHTQYFAAVDCTGHGVPGAMLSIIGHTALNRAIRENNLREPSDILAKLNEVLAETFEEERNVKDGMDLSLCKLDRKKKILTCASANNPVYIVRDTNKTKLDNYTSLEHGTKTLYKIDADKHSIGSGVGFEYKNHTIQLEEGDTIYIFSDGFADQFGGERGKKYKYRQFQQFLMNISDLHEDEQLSLLKKEFTDWKKDIEQIDDVLVIGVNI